jgi:hypothetical protein
MGAQYKVLGQVTPASLVNTVLYTAPSTANTIVSTLAICNPNAAANVQVQIAVIPNGTSFTQKNYIAYNLPIPFYDTITLTLGLTLSGNDSIQVYANGYSNVSFSAFGTEIT